MLLGLLCALSRFTFFTLYKLTQLCAEGVFVWCCSFVHRPAEDNPDKERGTSGMKETGSRLLCRCSCALPLEKNEKQKKPQEIKQISTPSFRALFYKSFWPGLVHQGFLSIIKGHERLCLLNFISVNIIYTITHLFQFGSLIWSRRDLSAFVSNPVLRPDLLQFGLCCI